MLSGRILHLRDAITRSSLAVLSGVFITTTVVNSSFAQDAIPVEALSNLPALANLSLSRDGDYMVGLVAQPGAERASLAVWDPRDLSKPPVMTKPDGDVEFIGAQALKAGKILVFARTKWTGVLAGCGEGKIIGSTKTYLTKVFVTDTNFSKFSEPFNSKSKGRGVTEFEEVCSEIVGTANVAADLPLDPENIIISRRSGVYDRAVSYVKFNLRTGDSELLFKNRGDGVGLMDPRNGDVLTRVQADYGDGRYKAKHLIKDASGEFKVHEKLTSDSQDRHNVSVLHRNEKTGQYIVATDQFSDNIRIYEYDPSARSFKSSPKFSDAKFDVSSVIRSEKASNFGDLIGYRVNGLASKTKWTDPVFQAAQSSFERKFPGKNINIFDWTQSQSKFLITVDGGDTPPSYFIYESGTGAKFLGTANPELTTNTLTPTKLIYYTSRDGLKIPGLLDMPAGWKPGSEAPPAIIHPHGGPWARDYDGWDPTGWVPFLTSRGYAVLRPQYRGSTGWGRKLWLAGDAEWGQKMQDDKDDGAAWMVEQGYANADKIAILGYSYGGYAAFAAAVRDDSPYACAIGGAGVSALTKLGRTWSSDPRQRAYQGKTVRGMDPMENTDKANIPVLVFHGDRDVRVPMFHGKGFYKKVKNKVPAKMVSIKDMPHSLPWTPKMQKQSLTAIEQFLKNDCF